MHEAVFLAGAEHDLIEYYALYEAINPGLGERFSSSVDEAVGLLCSHPDLGIKFRSQFRRLLVRGFPIGIFYTLEGQRIIIQAVLDLRQSPESIRRRLAFP